MRGCEVMWNEPKARVVRELLGCAAGKPCTARTKAGCPILPKSLAVKPKTTRIYTRLADGRVVLTDVKALGRWANSPSKKLASRT